MTILLRPGVPACAIALLQATGGCGQPASPDASQEILERLDRIETRLAAMEAKGRQGSEARPPRDEPRAADPDAAPTLADPFAQAEPEQAKGSSLAIAVTRSGWSVEGKTIDEAGLRELLEGVGSVTVRTDDGVSHKAVVELIDILREAEIHKIAIARFSDQSVTAGSPRP